MQVTKEQIKQAKEVKLRDYIMSRFPMDAKVERSGWAVLKSDHSMRIKEGYEDMASGEHGNAIDYLTKHMGFSFPDAVLELLGGSSSVPVTISCKEEQPKEREQAPTKTRSSDRVRSYLLGRGIDSRFIEYLLGAGLLYQDHFGNCVFMNRNNDYAEIKGTGRKKWVRNWGGGFCWYMGMGDPVKSYLTESAIDAVSLAQLRKENAYYISVGGVAMKERIKKVVKEFPHVILAVDNDGAGETCRQEHAELPAIIPEGVKDWNEVLTNKERRRT